MIHMRTNRETLSSQLVRVPCARCVRVTAFTDEAGLCPTCRCRDLEVEHGLRPGLFHELVIRSVIAPENRPRRLAAPVRSRRAAVRVS